MLFKNKVVLLAGLEAVSGQEPDASAFHGVLVNSDMSYTPEGDKVERDAANPTFSPQGHVIGVKTQKMSFSVEGKGGGVNAGVPLAPEMDVLLQACGLVKTSVVRLTGTLAGHFEEGETVQGGTSHATGVVHRAVEGATSSDLVLSGVTGTFANGETVTGEDSDATLDLTAAPVPGLEYAPTSTLSLMKSIALRFFWDSHMHLLLGVRGDLKIALENGKYPKFSFDFQGLWADPEDAGTVPKPVLSKLVPPRVRAAQLRIGTYSPVASKVELSLANTLAKRQDINAPEGINGIMITGRKPAGSVDPEADTLATFNPYAVWKAAGASRISCVCGSDPGNRILFEVPGAVLDSVGQGDRDGVRTYSLPFVATGQDDDELFITIF